MDYKDLAKQFIEDGAWDGVPAIAVRLFAQWLEEHEAAEQSMHTDAPYWVCLKCGEVSYINSEKCLYCNSARR